MIKYSLQVNTSVWWWDCTYSQIFSAVKLFENLPIHDFNSLIFFKSCSIANKITIQSEKYRKNFLNVFCHEFYLMQFCVLKAENKIVIKVSSKCLRKTLTFPVLITYTVLCGMKSHYIRKSRSSDSPKTSKKWFMYLHTT